MSWMPSLKIVNNESSDKPNPHKSFNTLHEIRLKKLNRLIFAHVNIITIYIDVLLISETKLNASFLSSQFLLDGFTSPYRLDWTQRGGNIMVFIREDIPSKSLNVVNPVGENENLLVEINLPSENGLLHVLTTHI